MGHEASRNSSTARSQGLTLLFLVVLETSQDADARRREALDGLAQENARSSCRRPTPPQTPPQSPRTGNLDRQSDNILDPMAPGSRLQMPRECPTPSFAP